MKDLELQFRSFNKQTWDFKMFFSSSDASGCPLT